MNTALGLATKHYDINLINLICSLKSVKFVLLLGTVHTVIEKNQIIYVICTSIDY